MTKDQEIAELKSQIGVQVKELILLSQAAHRHEQNCFELKAQVNALRGLLESASNSSEPGWVFEMTATIDELLDKTPQQCLAEYRNSVIDECINYHSHCEDSWSFAVRQLEKLKND